MQESLAPSPSLGQPLDMVSLSRGYRERTATPHIVLEALRQRIEARGADGVWISLVSADALRAAVEVLERRRAAGDRLPLYGLPFGVKDNIDVVGFATTAGCAAFAYSPTVSAVAVARLVDAGAVVMGKTNLDQFATGLVGVRSPFGIPRNPFHADFITGGSSSGSAAAVARGDVTFALGTDTAGSGRVPAGFNNIVGLKPSPGVLSTTGVVPACRSLDCLSVFAGTCEDAASVAGHMQAFDASDPYARADGGRVTFQPAPILGGFRCGILPERDREFLNDAQAARAYESAIAVAREMGGSPIEFDFAPFREVGALLYDGPFVAQRLEAAGELFARKPESLIAPLRAILAGARRQTAQSAYAAEARLRRLRRRVDEVWKSVDCLLLPTAPTLPRIADVEAEPIKLNSVIGLYSTFANLLDLAALAVPAGFRGDALPSGVTFLGPWGSDARLAGLGTVFHRRTSSRIGATSWPIPSATAPVRAPATAAPSELASPKVAVTDAGRDDGMLLLAVVGAHLSGEPLNHELTGVGGQLRLLTRTSPRYRFVLLPGTVPAKPGLVRVDDDVSAGFGIEVEVWALPAAAFGTFVARIPAPLGVGKVELEDGTRVSGFLCEGHATRHALDLSALGGWRAFRQSQS
jgi:allophanate hydrolase